MPEKTSSTTIGAGTVETAQPDAAALAAMNGDTGNSAVAVRSQMELDGSYVPAENKIYTEYMKISYGVGFGAEIGCAPGSLVLGKKDILVGPKTPLKCIIVHARGFWREWKAYDRDSMPQDFQDEATARKAGFRTQHPPRGSGLPMRNCAPAVDLALFVQRPATGTSSLAFTLRLDNELYAPVRFVADRQPYSGIERMLSQLPLLDAADRGVPPGEGRLSAFLVSLSTLPEIDRATGKTKVLLNLNPVLGPDNRPLRVSDKVHMDIASLAASIRAAASAPATTGGDEAPAY